MNCEYSLNVFIYDNSQAHRLKLERIVRDYAENSSTRLGASVSTSQPSKILNFSMISSGLYLLNVDDLEKITDGIEFSLNLRNNDLYGSIVFLAEHDIFTTGRSELAVRSLSSHVIVMSFLAKDSVKYENEITECIAAHTHKMYMPVDVL